LGISIDTITGKRSGKRNNHDKGRASVSGVSAEADAFNVASKLSNNRIKRTAMLKLLKVTSGDNSRKFDA
jgi:hypothetical protein